MEPLLKITTVPLEYELKIQHARFEKRGRDLPPLVEMEKQRGGLEMRSRPARLLLDTYEARNSVCPDTKTVIGQAAQKGMRAAEELGASYSREAAQMRWSKPGEGGEMLEQIFAQRVQMPDGQFQMAFIPAVGPEITYQEGSLETNYRTDRLAFDLRLRNGGLEYVPGSIDMIITQYPDVQIEYMGEPMYIPPSAAEMFIGGSIDVSA